MMKLDYLIPASLTDGFCGQIAFFRLCLDALGGEAAAARLVAVFGDAGTEELPQRWRRHFDRIGVEWVRNPPGEVDTYQAQHDRRFALMRRDCDLALLCDADVAPLRQIGEMGPLLAGQGAIGGVIAHLHWSPNRAPGVPQREWAELSRAVLGRALDCTYRYTLLPPDSPPQTPFYVNYGMLAGPPDLLSRFHPVDLQMRAPAMAAAGPLFGQQLSPALACAALGLNTVALPMRYNFPNDIRADALYPEELKNVVFMHYLRGKAFRREEIFADPAAFDAFVTDTSLVGSNGVFRRHVLRLTGGNFPFPS